MPPAPFPDPPGDAEGDAGAGGGAGGEAGGGGGAVGGGGGGGGALGVGVEAAVGVAGRGWAPPTKERAQPMVVLAFSRVTKIPYALGKSTGTRPPNITANRVLTG